MRERIVCGIGAGLMHKLVHVGIRGRVGMVGSKPGDRKGEPAMISAANTLVLTRGDRRLDLQIGASDTLASMGRWKEKETRETRGVPKKLGHSEK